MKQNKFSIVVLLLILHCMACKKDFLEVNDTQQLYRQSNVKDLNSMGEFMNGVYVILAKDFFHGMGAAYPDLVADNLMPVSEASNNMISHYFWTQQVVDDVQTIIFPGSLSMNPIWSTGYRGIRACNFVIEEVDKYNSENPTKADNIKGQAYALRAYLHFVLVNTFAQSYNFTSGGSHLGVPYISTSDITKPYSRQTVDEDYSLMIEDLNNSISLLPENVTDTRIMNRNAAKALLARIFLFKEDYSNAKKLAMEIAKAVPLMSISSGYPDDLYKFKAPSQTESLFQLSPSSTGYFTDYLSRYLRRSPIRFVATSDIALILKENPKDIRQAWVTSATGQWNVRKFPVGVDPNVTQPERSYFPSIIRSSEMFLTVAEAAAKEGDENTARLYIDSIRRRSNPLIGSVTATGKALLDSIYKERRKELCFESLRMYDLQRWKLGVHRTDILPNAPKNLPYPSDKGVAPIPPSDVQFMGLEQNASY